MVLHIQNIHLPASKRVLITSDVHGNLKRFKKLLETVHYSDQDILIIMGDICEKGENSLGLLRYCMQLQAEREVYISKGNCDDVYEDIMSEDEEHDAMVLRYMLWRKHCLFNEMSEELQYPVHKDMNMQDWKQQIRKHFAKELTFLHTLPDMLEAESYRFVHAGMPHGEPALCQPQDCLTATAFLNKNTIVFDKTLFVGHWPVSLYHEDRMDFNPILDAVHHVVAMDGGNVIKAQGQLNMAILQDGKLSFTYVDELPTIMADHAQQASMKSIQITYQDAEIERLEIMDEFTLCRHISSQYTLYIPTCYLYENENRWYSEDFTDYRLAIKPNEEIAVLLKTSHGLYGKKQGVCGWYV